MSQTAQPFDERMFDLAFDVVKCQEPGKHVLVVSLKDQRALDMLKKAHEGDPVAARELLKFNIRWRLRFVYPFDKPNLP